MYLSRALTLTFVAFVLTMSARSTVAINFVLTFDDTNSLTPNFDSDGSQLTAIMESAAEYWEDVILDTQTINITYFWDDLNDPTIGNHNGTSFSGSVETGMTLRFDVANNAGTARNWYFDPDTTTSDEFDFQTTLYRDLNTTNQVGGTNAWYGGNPQDFFEVSHQGNWIDTNLGFDLYTVAIHEIGHGLGMTGSNPASVTETADFDYDLPTSLTDGRTISINTAGTSANARAHIAPTNALMFTGNQPGRTFPSYSDVLSMAAVSGWSQIDLPRKYFASGSNFQSAGNWIGNRVPDSGDDVFLLSDNAVYLSNTTFLNSLTIEEGNSLDVDDEILYTFTDLNLIARPGAGGGNPSINADSSGLISVARDMNVAGGTINLSGNELAVGNELNFSDVDTRKPAVFGHGELRVYNQINGLADFFATSGQTLEVINSGSNQSIEVGRLLAATSGNLTFTGFDEVEMQTGTTLFIGPNRTASFSNLDTAPFLSQPEYPDINFNGTPGNPTVLVLIGSNSKIKANVNINAYARVQGTATWEASEVDLDEDTDVLSLEGQTTFNGVTFSGEGTVIQRGLLLVNGTSTVNTKYYDWDGDGGSPVNTQINPYATLRINSSQIEPIGSGAGYDGVATVYGYLEVNTYLELLNPFGPPIQLPDAWKLNAGGVLSLISSSSNPYVGGSGVEVFGTVEAFGEISGIENMALEPGGIVNVNDSTAELRLYGDTRLRGGTILGPGTLTNRLNLYVDANMSIDTQAFQWSDTTFASLTIGNNYTLTINSPILNEGNTPYEGSIHIGNNATLSVNSSGITEWGNVGNITLAGGQVNGKPVHNMEGGVIEGNGLIFGTTFTNDGTIRPNNEGLVRVHTTGTPDLDGVNNNGHIDVTDGDFFAKSITPFGPVDVDFHGTIEASNSFGVATDASVNFTLLGEITSDNGVFSIVDFTNAGTFRGSGEFVHDYVQHPTGILALELAGTAFGAYDRLFGQEDALLAGILQIDFAAGYFPSVGNTFSIIQADRVLGDFDAILAPAGYIFDVQYPNISTATLTLLEINPTLPGDLNGDGFVGINDLNIVLANWNQNVPPANPLADPSGDGFVGIDDLNEVLGNWNAGTPPSSDLQAHIPEPNSLWLVGATGLALRRSRRFVSQ